MHWFNQRKQITENNVRKIKKQNIGASELTVEKQKIVKTTKIEVS